MPPQPLQFRTKRELALSTLSEAIRSGRYSPGQQLRQTQLVEELGLGATPVREAVLELLARGVLVQESHHSVRVAELDLPRLRNIYRVRALLETEAAKLGTARISEGGVARMGDLLARMRAGQAAGEIASVAEADIAFHETLYRAADNPILFDLITQVNLSFPGSILWNIEGRMAQSLQEHAVILKAVGERDPTEAAFAVERHLSSAFSALETHIAQVAQRAGSPRLVGGPGNSAA